MLNQKINYIVISIFILILSACSGEKQFGETFTPGAITPIAVIDSEGEKYIGKSIQMEGEITKVCTTMKCWFYMKDAKNKQVHVDLEMNKHFAADISSGDQVIVKGTIQRSQPNSPKLSLIAHGIIVK